MEDYKPQQQQPTSHNQNWVNLSLLACRMIKSSTVFVISLISINCSNTKLEREAADHSVIRSC